MLSSLGITPTHKHKHKKNGHVCFSCTYTFAYVAVIPSKDNIEKQMCFFFLCFVLMFFYAYVAAVLTNVLLMLMR